MAEERKLEQITCLRDTKAGTLTITRGKVYKVPDQVSEKDAQLLIALKKAAPGKVKVPGIKAQDESKADAGGAGGDAGGGAQ